MPTPTPDDFFERLNDDLAQLEASLAREEPETHCNVYLLGLPRSGTTLLTQILYNNLDVACTNNLMARFWRTPLVGCHLSRAVLGDVKQAVYRSDYGKTEPIDSPHEYSYFWHRHLGLRFAPDGTVAIDHGDDLSGLRLALLGFNAIAGRALVHKPLELLLYRIGEFDALFQRPIYVWIERALEDIAASLVHSRLDRHGTVEEWWGSYPFPEDQRRLIGASWDEQIAGQVYYLDRSYRRIASELDGSRLVRVAFDDVCRHPSSVLEAVQERSASLGREIARTGDPPATFPRSGRRRSSAEQEAVDRVLRRLDELRQLEVQEQRSHES